MLGSLACRHARLLGPDHRHLRPAAGPGRLGPLDRRRPRSGRPEPPGLDRVSTQLDAAPDAERRSRRYWLVPSTAERVAAAMEAVPRKGFLPPAQRPHSHRDAPLPIGHGQTNSQPHDGAPDARAARRPARRPGPRRRVGSGWTTALLARLTGPTGSVTGVERVPDLVAFGAANLAAAGMPWAHVERGRARRARAAPADGPFDRILVSAQAAGLPAELVAQLAPGGVLVVPVAGRMLRVRGTRRRAGGRGARVVPLRAPRRRPAVRACRRCRSAGPVSAGVVGVERRPGTSR